MISQEERQSIIDEAVEKALLKLPEVIGNLITNQMNLIKMNREFYKSHPELAKSKDIVASVIEAVEGENPNLGYEKLLEKALPLINERVKIHSKLDFKTLERPNRQLPTLKSDHGEI